MKHLPAIDGLRAVAVLSVVAYHAGLAVPAGFVGVDVFFVISGYLITRLLHAQGPRIDFADFYARRARRILPAAVLVIMATLALSMVLLPPKAAVAESAGAAALFVANVYFQFATGDYWSADAATMPLLHLWSLSVEEQFYLAWPLLLLVRRRWMLVTAIASLLLAEVLVRTHPAAAFYQMPARAWELAAGGLVALYAPRVRSASWIGSMLIALAIALPLPHFPGVGALPAVVGAALILSAVHHGARIPWLEAKPMVWIGLISYSLYLWHWPLLAIVRASRVGEAPLSMRLLLCAIAIVLAAATYRYVEQPFRRMRFPNLRTVVAGASCSAVLGLSACAIGWQTDTAKVDHPVARIAERDYPSRRCHATGMEPARIKCPSTARTLVWGDSMAYAWMPAFPGAAQATRNSCAPMVGRLPARPMPADLKCRDYNDLVLARARDADTVVLAGWWLLQRDVSALEHTVRHLSGVRRILIVGPSPTLPKDAPECIRLRAESACSVPRRTFEAQAQPILAQLHALAARHPNVAVLDVTDDFCTASACPPVKDGVPLYWDTHHVSSTVARGIAARLGGGVGRVGAAADAPVVR